MLGLNWETQSENLHCLLALALPQCSSHCLQCQQGEIVMVLWYWSVHRVFGACVSHFLSDCTIVLLLSYIEAARGNLITALL